MATVLQTGTHDEPGTRTTPATATGTRTTAAATDPATAAATGPAAAHPDAAAATGPAAADAATGTYEVLRHRLAAQAAELARRTGDLDARRTRTFGSVRLELAGTEQLGTARACVPRDVVAVGNTLLLGCTTAPGAGPEAGTAVDDVFALYDRDLNRLPGDAVPGLLDDPAFGREFAALYRYYRQAQLLQLRRTAGRLLAVFRIGEKSGDIRVLRWSVADDGQVTFLDARGERDHVLPPAHDLTWTAATREDHVTGRHPHISVGGEVQVSTVGGTLTVRTDDGTGTAGGEYCEPVDEPLQSLADADVAHARVGPLVLLRVRPYKEETHRYLVFHTLTGSVVRLDGIGQACRRLPGDQGIVFPGGYCLATGEHKTYDAGAPAASGDPAGAGTEGLQFARELRSPNGEDVLYAFHDPAAGRGLLLSYHTIRKETAPPLHCRGWALFDDGTLMVLRTGSGEAARVHPVQRWRSPYSAEDAPTHTAAPAAGTGLLARIGNADLVAGIADCLSVSRAAAATTHTAEGYEALCAACVRTADRHHWLGEEEAGDLRAPLDAVRATAGQALAEFETVAALTRQATEALDAAADRAAAVVRTLRGEAPRSAAAWVTGLTELRHAHGQVLTLRDMRGADPARVAALAADVAADLESFGRRAAAFLARDDAFAGHHERLARLLDDAAALTTVAAAAPVTAGLDTVAAELHTVTEVVGSLDTGDTPTRTAVLEQAAEALAGVNRVRATLDARRRELLDREGRAASAAELALLSQTVTAALAAADTPAACDEQLARVLVHLEDLESRFAEYDDIRTELADRRTALHEAFAGRRQSLADAAARRAEQLAASGHRVLGTVTRRLTALPDAAAVAAYLASDPLVTKVRRTADELRAQGEAGRAEELDGRLEAARQEAARVLRDRADLYGDDGRTVRFGSHRFAVNTQPFDLTLLPGPGGLVLAVTGTDYRAPVAATVFSEAASPKTALPPGARPDGVPADTAVADLVRDRRLPSESPQVYRAEHLAARLLHTHGPAVLTAADDLRALVREAVEDTPDEGYERGVHDHDATLVLGVLLRLYEPAGSLRHEPAARATAQLFWAHGTTGTERAAWARRVASLARARDTLGPVPAFAALRAELAAAIDAWTAAAPGAAGGSADGTGADGAAAAAYLCEELTTGPEGFVVAAATRELLDAFHAAVDAQAYADDLTALDDLAARRQLAAAWLSAYAAATRSDLTPGDLAEAVAAELCPGLPRHVSGAPLTGRAEGLLGVHPRLTGSRLTVRIDEFLARTERFRERDVPAFRAFQRQRTAFMTAERARLRLDEHLPRVAPEFVRGRLVDEVCLPLVGASLAGQLGTVGETGQAGRPGTGGLLLLLSPPGHGKTSLMEYVADRLGLLLVRVSGPALGRGVTSLDPAGAPDAAARREVEKINFALAAGGNTLLYVDDIQHTAPELLEKFIPLCDATRRIEGVRDGAPCTYDLRGKRFAVCMAGNPYTGSGSRFRLPDMLANRADVWDLGEVLTGKDEAFAASFVENALTSNPVLAPLAGRDRTDLDLLTALASGDPAARADRLRHPYAAAELDQVLAVLRHLLTARDTVLAVGAAYRDSAARSAASRTEPPFLLQGSYRTMNRIAQRIRPVMNDAELAAVVDDHYAAEARTLGDGAEANLLKLAELRGSLTGEQAVRWAAVKETYAARVAA